MKLVTAIIKPFKLDDVHERLTGLGVKGITITEVKGMGRNAKENIHNLTIAFIFWTAK